MREKYSLVSTARTPRKNFQMVLRIARTLREGGGRRECQRERVKEMKEKSEERQKKANFKSSHPPTHTNSLSLSLSHIETVEQRVGQRKHLQECRASPGAGVRSG